MDLAGVEMRRNPTNSMPAGACRTLGAFTAQHVVDPCLMQHNLVESIADLDVPDCQMARSLSIKALPSTTPYIIVQYREPISSDRCFGDIVHRHDRYHHVATIVHSGVVTVRPAGPIGVIIARLRPEVASRFVGDGMQELMDAKIGLGDVIGPGRVSLLHEMVSEAGSSAARIELVLRFLHENTTPREADALASYAAKRLRQNPFLRIQELASELSVSERHLSRRFYAIFGTSPKRFARMARLEKVLAARATGSSWAGLAHGCGYADQAHMINDFRAILGASPDNILQSMAKEASSRGSGMHQIVVW